MTLFELTNEGKPYPGINLFLLLWLINFRFVFLFVTITAQMYYTAQSEFSVHFQRPSHPYSH